MPYAYMAGDNCYGRGDYYRGDYYRGDPFLGGIVKAIGKGIGSVAKVASNLLPGPVGTIARAGLSLFNPKQGTALAPSPPPFIQPPVFTGVQLRSPIGSFALGAGTPSAFGPPPEFQQPVGTMLPQGFLPGCQLKGTRPNKSSYYRAVPGNPMQGVLIPKGSVCVKSRRMNIANPRALRRAVRRAQGFAKMARRVMSFVDAKAPRGRARFKRKR